MYAIAGVSGNTGSVVATTLLAGGHPVRVLVRDAAKGAPWKAKGAEVAVVSLHDREALAAALRGVAGAYLLLPPDRTSATPLEDAAKLSATLAAAAAAARVPHVVLLSSVGAQHPTGTGPIRSVHQAEADFRAAGVVTTAVRASYFQENWGLSLGGLAQGVLPTFTPAGVRFAQVATADIGRTAAAALVEGPVGNASSVIELAGPRDYSATDAAEALSAILGKPIAVQEAPLDAVIPALTGMDVQPATAALYRELYEGVITGRVATDPASPRHVRGTTELATTLAKLVSA